MPLSRGCWQVDSIGHFRGHVKPAEQRAEQRDAQGGFRSQNESGSQDEWPE
jgi:hypothetical protein